MATAPTNYPKPTYPTGFMIFNPHFTKGTILYLHGINGIGAGTNEPWGLPSLLPPDLHLQFYGTQGGRGELPKDLIEYAEKNEMCLIAPQCDRAANQGGWSLQMVDNVLVHPAVKDRPKETFHLVCYSLGGGAGASYMLTSIANSAKFATAFVCYTVQVSGNYANIVNAKTIVVGVTAVKDSTCSPSYTTGFVDALNNAGANPKAIKKVFDGGDHGGKLPELFQNTPYPELENMGMYDFMKAKSRGTPTQPPTNPPTKTEDFKFTRNGKSIIGWSDKTWEEK